MVAVADPQARPAGRDLTWWQFLLLVLVYAAIIQVGGRVIGADVDQDEGWETAGNISESSLIPIALSSLFVIGIATWLRWWPQIVHEPLSVRRWLRIVPITLLLAAAVGSSWANLLDQTAGVVLALIAVVCLVGRARFSRRWPSPSPATCSISRDAGRA
jgi:hypothetical protein